MKKKGFVVKKIESEDDLGDMNFLVKDYPLGDLLGLYVEDAEMETEIDVVEKVTVGFMVDVHGRLSVEQTTVWKARDGTMIIEEDELENLY